ncbi:hypothetical protein GQ55_3G230200 [Panicum hallii var. hallii]|uniref:Uncharacterized protein n=1 Tax=Panicum hallii var. hallii TaxID=1504633 RepID=A0A2T7ECG4_9POAL|nr:hypothetical protein GQ55_3G230200 [Panicum hallii var. hallii]
MQVGHSSPDSIGRCGARLRRYFYTTLSTAPEIQYYTLLRCLVHWLAVRLATTTRPAPIALLLPWRGSSDDHGDGVAFRPPPALARGAGLGGRGLAAVHHGAAARRAGAAGQQPGVDAGDVEPVPAPREHAHLLAVRELTQADGAHLFLTGIIASLHAASAVNLHGDAPQRALLDPADAGRAARRRRRPLATAAASGVPGRAPAPAPERAPRHRVEPDGEQQREEERRQDDHHVGVEARVAGPRRRRRGPVAAAAVRGPPRRGRCRRARLRVPTVHGTSCSLSLDHARTLSRSHRPRGTSAPLPAVAEASGE